jgi:DNA-binding MarR family transcriptional regulator
MALDALDTLRHDTRCIVRELGLLRDSYFDVGVTLAERHLLIELQVSPNVDMKYIAEKLFLDKSTASRLIARAIKKDFVAISMDTKDKRRKLLHMTKKGEKTLQAFEKLARKQVQDALCLLSPDEVQLVYKGVSLFAKGLLQARKTN